MYSWPGVHSALDQRRGAVVDDLEVGGADRDRVDAHQHFGPARHRHRLVDQLELIGIAQHPGLHRVGDGQIGARLHAGGCVHRGLSRLLGRADLRRGRDARA